MALPNQTNLKTMDYAHKGQPFVDVPAKNAIDLKTMDYVLKGQPFVANPFATTFIQTFTAKGQIQVSSVRTIQVKASIKVSQTQTVQAKAQSHMFVELFDSNTYKDAGETDADWNLSLERVYLPEA